ncbi:hypothetical protein LSTR_LSTR009468 [Laodelphax striatellus]|uniref:18S rRNA (pseudouridine-N1)-methyltransferase n=1 Tax=Laodelphax striatellus TaxID=195883 RepID=A0A482WFG9_LAOST|nr:hypothetical protein LSTR_LSTR009468 [Laodelphax striatellus]
MGKRKLKEDEFDPAPKHLGLAPHIRNQEKRLIIILENAQLESVKVGNSYELLNCDDHKGILRKNDRDIGSCRPDIVYIHTEKNVLIEINPQTRIPRTFKRFAGLMVQLLHKFNVRSSDGPMKLLKVIKNPITDHLPPGCKKIGTSFSSNKIVNPKTIVPDNEPLVVVVGAMAHGQVKADYMEETISISNYPLSAALTCTKLCSAFEEAWNIV